jgi:hypothetical protein
MAPNKIVFCEEPSSKLPKNQMRFKQTPIILAIAGYGLAYDVAYLQFEDYSLEVLHFVKGNVCLINNFFSNVTW